MMIKRINRDDFEDLGFVMTCLSQSAISMDEMKLWALRLIDQYEVHELPDYLFDLIDFNDVLCNIDSVVGFVAYSDISIVEKMALYGIGYLRGIEMGDVPIRKSTAIKLLYDNKHILDRYLCEFPFIIMPAQQVDSAEASTIAVPPSEPSGSPR